MSRLSSTLLTAFSLLLIADWEFARGDEKLQGIACRSVHLAYPCEEAAAFYNEVTVEQSAPGTYFMVCGWSGGYFGIQELDNGKKLALFSVWDGRKPAKEESKEDAERHHVRVVKQAADVEVRRFTHEGSGGQCYFPFDWKLGVNYKFCVTSKNVADRHESSGFLFLPDKNEWHHLVTFSTTGEKTGLRGLYSFVEDFKRNKTSTTKTRRASFANGWAKLSDGSWHELTQARFTADSNPVTNIDAGQIANGFFLATGGDITNKTTPLRERLIRPADKVPPTLPNIP